MQGVRDMVGILWGMFEKEYLFIYPGDIVIGEIERDMYIAVELISRPTIRVVSHL